MSLPHTLIEVHARELGVTLSAEQLAMMAEHARLLAEWNPRVNLTAITDPDDVAVKHFADSLACLRVLDPVRWRNGRVLDLGSGAGFPGVPLRVAAPSQQTVLLDSVGKKTAFLLEVMQALHLDRTLVLTGRAEDLGRELEHRSTYDYVLARAVAELAVLIELALPLLRIGGALVAMKGHGVEVEVERARRALVTIGGKVACQATYSLPGIDEARTLVVIEKTRESPNQYPRRAGMPGKRPLV